MKLPKSLILISIVILFTQSAWAEREVRVRSEVRVSGRFVQLKDLLVSTTGLKESELELIILDSPERGSEKVSIRSIAFKMQVHESLLDLAILAPAMIKIIRVADVDFVEKFKKEIMTQLVDDGRWKNTKIDLQFNSDDINTMSDLTGADKIELLSSTLSVDSTNLKLRVKCSEKDKSLGTVSLNPIVQREIEVVILKNSLGKGDIVNQSDLLMTKAWSTGKNEDICLTFNDAIGFELKKSLVEGTQVPLSYLTEPVYAVKDQFIEVGINSDLFNVTVQAKALQLGRRGDVIRAMNTSSLKVIAVELVSYGKGIIK
jgi:flagellar basal body P-ring formation protein FlgA